jgi:hypothetical protein
VAPKTTNPVETTMHNKLKFSMTVGIQLAAIAAFAVACSDSTDPAGTSSSAGAPASAGTSAGGSGSSSGGAHTGTGGTPAPTAGSTAGGGLSGVSGSPAGGTGAGGMTGSGGAGGAVTGGGGATGGGGTGAGGAAAGTGAGGGSSGGAPGGACANGATAQPCPPTEENSIAYIGCSMADNIGQGYGQVGGKIMWNNSGYGTGAKVVENWGANGDGWSLFNTKLNAIGGKDKVKAIMVQICILQTRSEDNVKAMIQAARDHTNPGTHIYIVGQPSYEAGHSCFLAGDGGAEWTEATAQKMAKDPAVNKDMTYLGQFKLDTTKGESSDGCHAAGPGFTALGNQAKAYWGG